MEALKILACPISVILIVVFIVLLLKKSIQDLIARISGIKYGKIGADVAHPRQEKTEKSFFEQEDNRNETIEKALGIFSATTLERAKNVVESESKINEVTDVNKKVETLTKYAEALYLILSFDRLYNTIFGSQLFILDFVNTDNTQTKEQLKIFYDNAKEKNSHFFDTYSYDDYIEFLVLHELIVFAKDGSCGITWLGRDFLKYLIETGKTFNKRY